MDINKDLYYNSYYDDRDDKLYMYMTDVDTNEKFCNVINAPRYDIYQYTKPTNIYEEYILKEDTITHNISYKWREYDMARILGIRNFAELVKKKIIKRSNVFLNKQLFGTDLDIKDYQIMRYTDKFKYDIDPKTGYKVYDDAPPIRNIHIGYLDIETDIKVSDDRNEQPIYMITYVDGRSNICYTYYLKNDEYNGIEELQKNPTKIKDNMERLLREDIAKISFPDDNIKEGLIKKIITGIVAKMKYIVVPFDEEAEMIKKMWQMVMREYKPYFLLIFNAEYDISQTQMRAAALGIDEKELFTCPEIGDYVVFDYSDKTFNPGKRRHNYDCASYTKIVDSMNLHYQIRAAESFESHNLSDTGERNIGFRKLGYGHICDHIMHLPYKDFITTYMYNVRDVLLMVFLEAVLRDVEFMISVRFLSRTEYDRVFVPLTSVINSFYHIALRNDKIMQPNINKHLAKLDKRVLEELKETDPVTYKLAMAIQNREPVPGGLCSIPSNFIGEGKIDMLSFMSSDVATDIVDEDAESMYPNNTITSLISKSRLFGRIAGINGVTLETVRDVQKYILAIINKDWINIGALFYNLPTLNEILETLRGFVSGKPKVDLRVKLDKVDKIIPETKKFKELDKILSKLLRPKVNQNDEDVERNMYLLSKEPTSHISYYGTLVSATLKKNNEPISMFDYLGIDSDKIGTDFVLVDKKNKIVDNSLLDEVKVKKESLITNKVPVITTPITKWMTELKKDSVENRYFEVSGHRLDVTGRLLIMNEDLIPLGGIKTINVKDNIKLTGMKSANMATDAIIKYNIFDVDKLYTVTAYDKDGVDITSSVILLADNSLTINTRYFTSNNELTVTFINKSNGKKKSIIYHIIDVNLGIYDLDFEEDYIKAGLISYAVPIDNDVSIELSQEFVFVNYDIDTEEVV